MRVNVDLFDSLEALLAKMQAGNTNYDVICPSNYAVEILLKQELLRPLDHSALPHLRNVDPAWLDRDFDPGNRHSVPYFTGTCGIAYRKSRVGEVDSWAIGWYASMFLEGGLTIFPARSLLENIGFDGTGAHSGTRVPLFYRVRAQPLAVRIFPERCAVDPVAFRRTTALLRRETGLLWRLLRTPGSVARRLLRR